MRALELQRPLIRVTNTGISAVYDPIAKSQLSMPQFKADVLEANITLIQGDTLYSRLGNWPVWLAVLLLTVIGLIRKTKANA